MLIYFSFQYNFILYIIKDINFQQLFSIKQNLIQKKVFFLFYFQKIISSCYSSFISLFKLRPKKNYIPVFFLDCFYKKTSIISNTFLFSKKTYIFSLNKQINIEKKKIQKIIQFLSKK
ncbi:hypothetical protein IMG5_117010 [Ichthyophthirius multifiliis]|uniref:Uncharacterized protein n=1 Tax=Ichthyophthirius multifiliis TaxID=5932 RepID=G0QUG6_ICHMU|nr:hypothetical protein IMG5_117010 [Ichthyophthirius multifiliis]EGR31136.1 hypothetical protein IMG5_117010 [Ichthyophthirius multifiliis]|eukprot:XP_004034622.1 hypothetical protein IMG5_117010 [Ichthyophthirius multifiliis]